MASKIHRKMVDFETCEKCSEDWPCENERQRRVISEAHNILDQFNPNFAPTLTLLDKIEKVVRELQDHQQAEYDDFDLD